MDSYGLKFRLLTKDRTGSRSPGVDLPVYIIQLEDTGYGIQLQRVSGSLITLQTK